MRTTPRFVTPTDFNNYTGKILEEILDVDVNNENYANLFLMRIEDRLLTRINVIGFQLYEYTNLSDFQKENLQKAIIEQADYILRNSDIFTDSGYELDKGKIISSSELYNIEICRIAKDYLLECGLLNYNIKNRRRFPRF